MGAAPVSKAACAAGIWKEACAAPIWNAACAAPIWNAACAAPIWNAACAAGIWKAAYAALALLLVSGAAQAQVPSGKPQAAPAAKKAARAPVTHVLHLTAVRLERTGWTEQGAMGVVRGAGRILGRCGVLIERVELVSLAVPPVYMDLATPVSGDLANNFRVAKPAVYFVRNTRRSPAFEAEAFGRANTRTRPELADTVWITLTARDPAVALAHELAHVLMDSGEHSEEPGNLMRDQTSSRNTTLTPAQCTRLRDTATANGLLKKAK